MNNKRTQQDQQPVKLPFERKKTTSRAVVIADKLADRIITIGGILVIIAVLGILVFLVGETLPLFQGGEVTAEHRYTLDIPSDQVLTMTMDEYKTMGLLLFADGTTHFYHAKTGTTLASPQIEFDGKQLTAVGHPLDRSHLAFGFADGTVQLAEIQFETEILRSSDLPTDLTTLDDRDSTDGTAIYSRIPGNQFRKIALNITLEEAVEVTEASRPVTALDYQVSGEAERQLKAFVVVDDEGMVTLNLAKSKINLLTGKRRTTVSQTQLPLLPEDVRDSIHSILLSPKADAVMIADRNGTAYRYNTQDTKAPILAEVSRVLPQNVQLVTFDYLLGGQSIVVVGSDGSLNIWFILNKEVPTSEDGQSLVRTRTFASNGSPMTLFSPSNRGKSFALAYRHGEIRILHGTSQKTLARFAPDAEDVEYHHMLLAPRFDGLMALQANGEARLWDFSVPHPETTFRTLFQKVWYEGYSEPSYTWQSTGATENFESKFSLIPLIFGTIKATFYSLLFAIPIAILGAIYTSEFVHFRVRGVVKPIMEMMASLPSVVLGFVAALVLAPIVETWIAAVILACIALPVALMASAFVWQLLPFHLANRWRGIPKFSLMIVIVLITFLITYKLGLLFEILLFGGDFKAWLNGDIGSATPFLFLLLLPVTFTLLALIVSRIWGRRISQVMFKLSPFKAAIFDMLKWIVMVVSTLICSYGIAYILNGMGLDARGSFIDTYVQRNTLIVGFAMGFAVIPIIYTIAEDALNAVPEHLRAASLGCGATPWQTAIYVILPTAVSGVFSAIMIGMGRAVGETMIVVMAAGNTPLLDWNIFNGLRALSATIAVELPEAVKDGTLYRILFLSGLVLFAMTFVINTVAEIVRIRFRKWTAQL
ncbi:ABC transporter permease subunit [candidate division KSB3 bacterium]|uniref:ABC transporter permease subunit n=1 Tax=candidate division KSB3 bacterium TaxID=2044937 RepID=A0A9D5K0P1_9BACT|nr:ABC transporter permease subunit [candidate division KSB3 bacterium]MBD3327471.1 ABC transporter permease subunit [candidate division KSB3 bacterium]